MNDTAVITPQVDRLMACRRACDSLSDETVNALADSGGVVELIFALQELFSSYTDGAPEAAYCTCLRDPHLNNERCEHPANPCEACRAAAILNRLPETARWRPATEVDDDTDLDDPFSRPKEDGRP